MFIAFSGSHEHNKHSLASTPKAQKSPKKQAKPSLAQPFEENLLTSHGSFGPGLAGSGWRARLAHLLLFVWFSLHAWEGSPHLPLHSFALCFQTQSGRVSTAQPLDTWDNWLLACCPSICTCPLCALPQLEMAAGARDELQPCDRDCPVESFSMALISTVANLLISHNIT